MYVNTDNVKCFILMSRWISIPEANEVDIPTSSFYLFIIYLLWSSTKNLLITWYVSVLDLCKSSCSRLHGSMVLYKAQFYFSKFDEMITNKIHQKMIHSNMFAINTRKIPDSDVFFNKMCGTVCKVIFCHCYFNMPFRSQFHHVQVK